jgi:hypothetical protein
VKGRVRLGGSDTSQCDFNDFSAQAASAAENSLTRSLASVNELAYWYLRAARMSSLISCSPYQIDFNVLC